MSKGIYIRKIVPIEVRFWSRVKKTDTCWLWTGQATHGYGVIGNGRNRTGQTLVHRFSWRIHNGPIGDGLFVCHSCDVPLCVRPSHLFTGTQRDNIRDMARKGRHWAHNNPQGTQGVRNGNARLTPEQVSAIRLLRGKVSQTKIGEMFGIAQAHVSKIQLHHKWP